MSNGSGLRVVNFANGDDEYIWLFLSLDQENWSDKDVPLHYSNGLKMTPPFFFFFLYIFF